MLPEITKYPRPSEGNEYTQCSEITKYPPSPFRNHKVPEMVPEITKYPGHSESNEYTSSQTQRYSEESEGERTGMCHASVCLRRTEQNGTTVTQTRLAQRFEYESTRNVQTSRKHNQPG